MVKRKITILFYSIYHNAQPNDGYTTNVRMCVCGDNCIQAIQNYMGFIL